MSKTSPDTPRHPRDLSDLDGLPSKKRERKLRDMRPMEIALSAEGPLVTRNQRLDEWLRTVNTSESGAPLSAYADTIAEIVRYALSAPLQSFEADTLIARTREILADLISCPTSPIDPDSEALERVEPYLTDLTTVCCAALGRYRLEVEKTPIPDTWLAALASVTEVTIRSYVSERRDWSVPLKRPKGSRWHVTVGSARKFLAHRNKEDRPS